MNQKQNELHALRLRSAPKRKKTERLIHITPSMHRRPWLQRLIQRILGYRASSP